MIIALPGARAAGAAQYTIELTGSNGTTQSKTLAGGTSVQFDDLAPDTYSISVKGMDDAGTLVFSGTETATVVAGETATVAVKLQNLLGSLTVDFSGASATTGTTLTVTLTDSDGVSSERTSSGEKVYFENLIPRTYNIVVEGMDTNNKVVLGGASSATVVAGETASAKVELVEGVSDFAGLQAAVTAGGTVYIFESIDVETTLSVPSGISVTILPAYQDVTLKNTSTGNLFTFPSGSTGNLTIGGGEYIITLDGNQVAQSIISMSGGTATLADNGIITNAAASGVNISSAIFTMSGGILKDNKSSGTGGAIAMISGTCTITGGSITGNTAQNYGGGVCVSGGTFNLSGGSISNNSATYGSGVSVIQGSFKMSGSAVVVPDNDVYLLNNTLSVYVTSSLTGTTPVATITPNSYGADVQVLKAGDGVDLANEVGKFAVTPNGGEEWTIKDDGILMKDEGF